jgi:hypothetical protein
MACKSLILTRKRILVTAAVPQILPSPYAWGGDEASGRPGDPAVTSNEPFLVRTKEGQCDSHSTCRIRPECFADNVAVRTAVPSGALEAALGEPQIARATSSGDSVDLSTRPGADDCAGGSRSRRPRANPAAIRVIGLARPSSTSGWPLPHTRGGAGRILGVERTTRGVLTARRAEPTELRAGFSAPWPVESPAPATAPWRGERGRFLRPVDRGALRFALSAFVTRLLSP